MSPQLSLGDVFIEHRARLRQTAISIVHIGDLADEIMQDAYLKLVGADCVRHVQQPLYYCVRVVRNLAMDHFRRHSVEASYRSFGIEAETLEHPCGNTPERCLNQKRALAAAARILNTLPERTRRAFELYHLHGMRQRDIGASLGCSATLVNFMLRDAAEALRDCRCMLED